MPICVCTICGCICATKAEWSSGNKGLAAHRVGSTVPTHGLAQPWSGCCCAAQGWGAGYSVQYGGGIPNRLASVAWGRPELMALWQSQKSMGMRFWRMNSDLWGLALGTFGWFSLEWVILLLLGPLKQPGISILYNAPPGSNFDTTIFNLWSDSEGPKNIFHSNWNLNDMLRGFKKLDFGISEVKFRSKELIRI